MNTTRTRSPFNESVSLDAGLAGRGAHRQSLTIPHERSLALLGSRAIDDQNAIKMVDLVLKQPGV